MDSVVIFLVTGVAAGILAGLLGVGRGLIIVPALALYFSHAQLAVENFMHLAIGTSLATIVVTGLSSTLAHQRHGAVDWALVMRLAPGLIIGALSGAVLADHLASVATETIWCLRTGDRRAVRFWHTTGGPPYGPGKDGFGVLL